MGAFVFTPLEPFGVEVGGDLSAPIDEADQALLRTLARENGLLVARGQALSLERQLALMSVFGPVLGGRATLNYVAPDDGVLGTGALAFHSDLAFAPKPFELISLHAVDVVDGETCTRFADGARAYARLPTALRDRLQQLTVAQVSSSANGRTIGYRVPARAIRYDRPALLRHKETGEAVLYVTEGQSARFNELDQAQSDSLLSELFAVLYAPDQVFEHHWRTGDLVIWDNIKLQHARPPLIGVTRRKLQRVVVAEQSLYEQIPDFRPGDPVD